MSTNTGGVSKGKFGLNLSYHVQDEPADVSANRTLFFSELGIAETHVAFTQQMHTANVSIVTGPGRNENCDALITGRRNIFLAISVADCTPVLIVDPANNVIAGVHAGWRGAAGKIVRNTMQIMQTEFGTDAKDCLAFVGPSAGQCCYEVGREVASQFPSECTVEKKNGKFLLNVKQANVLQLLEFGVVNSNIDVHPDCTIDNDLYHSHRRDGLNSGRMFAVIGLTN